MPAAKFIGRYLEGFQRALAQVPPEAIEKVVALLEGALDRKATVFIAGNGGSASLASHLACDLEKTASGPKPRLAKRRLRAHSLNDNMATLTAWANDEGYELIFSEQLRAQAEPGDILVVISASGNSPNIVAALETAAELGLHTVALVGFDGGRALQLADLALHIPVKDYGLVEGAHGVLTHTITACLIANLAERAPAPAGPAPASGPFPQAGAIGGNAGSTRAGDGRSRLRRLGSGAGAPADRATGSRCSTATSTGRTRSPPSAGTRACVRCPVTSGTGPRSSARWQGWTR